MIRINWNREGRQDRQADSKYPRKETMTGRIHKEAITISKKKGDNVGLNQVSFTESTSVDGCKAMREKRSLVTYDLSK